MNLELNNLCAVDDSVGMIREEIHPHRSRDLALHNNSCEKRVRSAYNIARMGRESTAFIGNPAIDQRRTCIAPCAQKMTAFNEQKYLVDRCSNIKAQAYAEASAPSGFYESVAIRNAVTRIENYLLSVRSALSMQMLGELQAAGCANFSTWCARYGI